MAKASQVLGLSQLPILVLFLWCCSQSQVAISLSKVQFLPGFQGPLPFELETGYVGVGVGESDEVQLFYYFVKSEKNPQKDPLLLWLTGGPGCSAWSGFAYEIGPLKYKVEQYNGSLPTLLLNPNSWTKISNIIFVDSPVGTGFSYARTSFASHSGDFKQVNHLHQFIKKWLIDHPEFTSNSVYIGGDSYSGITLPILVQQISNGNNEGILPFINLQGYLLGNPGTGLSYLNSRIPYAHRMGLISDELYKSLEKSCGGEYQQIDPNSTECLKNFQVYEECTSRICNAHILEPNCPFASSKPEDNKKRLLTQDSELLLNSDSLLPSFGCREYEQLLSTYWANDPYVRNALHVRKGSIEKWQRCNYDLPYEKDAPSSVEYLVNLSARGYRSLVYSGDHDFLVPFIDTQKWIKSLNYSIVDDWRPWFVQDQIAGYTRTYSNYMTFATVKGGGHTAPQYKPKECLAMLEKWLNQEPL